jgi:hypothetical protein
VIVLDVMLPGLDGFNVLRELRRSKQTPVIMLTARDRVEDRVHGLGQGADDYLVKPFSFLELVARLQALVRRGRQQEPTELQVGDLQVNLLARRAYRDGARLDLTGKEFAAGVLAQRRGQILSKTVIAAQVWDINFDSNTNVVEVAIKRLRASSTARTPASCCTRCAAWATCWKCAMTRVMVDEVVDRPAPVGDVRAGRAAGIRPAGHRRVWRAGAAGGALPARRAADQAARGQRQRGDVRYPRTLEQGARQGRQPDFRRPRHAGLGLE